MRLTPILLVLLASTWTSAAHLARASEPPGAPFIDNYLPDAHGGHSQSWAVAQDPRGVMYFANGNSILEFDGINWRKIDVTSVLALDIDDTGRVYWGGTERIGYLGHASDGSLEVHSLVDMLPDGVTIGETVRDIYATSHGVYFINRRQVFRWHHNRLAVVANFGTSHSAKIGDEIVIVRLKPFSLYTIAAGVLHQLAMDNLDLIDDPGRVRPFALPNRDLLLATRNRGVFVYHRQHYFKDGSDEPDYRSPPNYVGHLLEPIAGSAGAYIGEHEPYKGVQLGPKRFAVGTLGGGVVILDDRANIRQIISKREGLNSDIILSVGRDQLGNLWALTQDGISYIQITSPISRYGKAHGIPEFVLSAAVTDEAIYAGTFRSTVVMPRVAQSNAADDLPYFRRLHPQIKGTWVFAKVENQLLLGDDYFTYAVHHNTAKVAIDCGKNAVFTIGTVPHFPKMIFLGIKTGLFAAPYSRETTSENGQPELIFGPPTLLLQTVEGVRSISAGTENDLWFSVYNSSLYNLRFDDGRLSNPIVKEYRKIGDAELEGVTYIVLVEGRVVISTANGFFTPTKRGPDGRSEFIPLGDLNTAGTLEGPLSDLYVAPDGRIWASTESAGLGHFARSAQDKWEWTERRFRKLKDVYEFVFNPDHSVLYTTGRNGLFRFDLKQKKDLNAPFNTIIRRVESPKHLYLDGGYFTEKSTGSAYERDHPVFKRTITSEQSGALKPTINYENNGLTFSYAATYYEHIPQTRYQVMLDGSDKLWSAWSPKTEKEYNNLFEGPYCFKVRAKNVFDTISDTARFCFVILPPWYRTPVAYVGYSLSFFIVLVAGIRLYTRRLLRAKRQLEQMVQQRTAQVVQQRDEIAHQRDEIEQARSALWGEMQLAQKIQTVLLPKQPHIPGYQITGFMETADEVGGDYYDVINSRDRHWLVIGDVSGHGVSAGLVMMMVQTAINNTIAFMPSEPPATILRLVNQTIYDNIKKLGEAKYMTLTLMALEPDGTISYSGLHQDILIYRKSTEKIEVVQTEGIWIGIVDDLGDLNSIGTFKLEPDDTMLLYTDGIIEAKDTDGEMYNTDNLKTILEKNGHLDPDDIKDQIVHSLANYVVDDDLTMLIVKREI